ncbi:hypothetical protein [Natronospira bacteriovora]|uniref:Uncharacterized protein n=1 Tax=Natronospira bacteriovora TaxID=3069753 RepID=A0ABU0W7C2_9GAMM|nr:hypothetical protein [Natronospira sp. AB-CW4]MDQ2069857.1 hypothetical protein [Natronospira sp. AB-CW4]
MAPSNLNTKNGVAGTAAAITLMMSGAAVAVEHMTMLPGQEENFLCPKATERGLEFAGDQFRRYLEDKAGESLALPEENEDFLDPLDDDDHALTCAGLNQYYADMINATRTGNDGIKYPQYNVSYFKADGTIVVSAEALRSPGFYFSGRPGLFTIFHDEDLNVLEWGPRIIPDIATDLLPDGLREKIRGDR